MSNLCEEPYGRFPVLFPIYFIFLFFIIKYSNEKQFDNLFIVFAIIGVYYKVSFHLNSGATCYLCCLSIEFWGTIQVDWLICWRWSSNPESTIVKLGVILYNLSRTHSTLDDVTRRPCAINLTVAYKESKVWSQSVKT